MFRHVSRITYNLCKVPASRQFSSGVISEKWDLLAAVCVERLPRITPPLNDIEERYKKLLNDLEHEQSLKSDFEIRDDKDKKQQALLKKGDDLDVVLKETAQEYLDACNDELTQFKYGNRTTEDDQKNDLQSLNRKLDKHLVLLINQKLGDKTHYLLPQGLRLDGETLRQAAERVMKEVCGTDIEAQFYGNAPSGFYKYKYPKEVQTKNEAIGAKVFIYNAKYKGGKLNDAINFKWLDRIELRGELKPKYYNSVSQFLVDER